jgi:hypothetical protein
MPVIQCHRLSVYWLCYPGYLLCCVDEENQDRPKAERIEQENWNYEIPRMKEEYPLYHKIQFKISLS